MTSFRPLMEIVGTGLDLLGVSITLVGMLVALGRALDRWRRAMPDVYRLLRQDVGRAILLGLEFLVAGDIIRTVAVDPNLSNVAALGGIILIRTFLSMSLQLELEGRWPWQATREARASTEAL